MPNLFILRKNFIRIS